MTKHRPGRILPILLALLLASCSSLPYSRQDKKISSLLDMLGAGDAAATARQTALPFVLDQELLTMPDDVERFWELAYQAGLDFSSAVILSIRKVDETSQAEIGTSWDMTTYTATYLPSDASLVEVELASGRFVLLLGGRRIKLPLLHGMRGPL